jgi:hypothetical protein
MAGFGDCIISSVLRERAAGVPGRYFQGHAVKPLIAIIIGPRALRKIQGHENLVASNCFIDVHWWFPGEGSVVFAKFRTALPAIHRR